MPDISRPYVHGHHASVLASHGTRTAANSCAYLLHHVIPGTTILDLGCGPGSITLELAELAGPDGRVVGVDSSAEAIDAARAAARERGDAATRFVRADLFSLEADQGFDVVHAHQVLQHLPDPVAALRRMADFCAPGGLVAVRDADYAAMTWYPETPGMDLWRRTYQRVARAAGGEPDAGRRLRAWANAAGLEVVTAGASTWTYATPGQTSWWAESQADRIRHSRFASQARDAGYDEAQVDEMARGWQAWGRHPDAWFCMVHGEILARPAH